MKITFSKMAQDLQEGTGTVDIFVDGVNMGWIEKESEADDVGSVSYVWKYTTYSYTVHLRIDVEDAELDLNGKEFIARNYANPRAALAASKNWARKMLKQERVETLEKVALFSNSPITKVED